MPIQFLNVLPHGALPGASDEILAVVFLIIAGLAGLHLFRRRPER